MVRFRTGNHLFLWGGNLTNTCSVAIWINGSNDVFSVPSGSLFMSDSVYLV